VFAPADPEVFARGELIPQSTNQQAGKLRPSESLLTSYSQIGPHAFLGEEAPLYPTGCKLILACSVTQMALAIMLRVLLIHRNKKRDEAAAALGHELDQEYTDGADLTDFENPHFRYVL
jgi:hypothetical protein